MWMDFLELEPQLKAMLGEMERGGVAFKVMGFGKRRNFCLVRVLFCQKIYCNLRLNID